MTNDYKLLVVDIDGTLVDHGSVGSEIHIDHPVKRGFEKAQQAGRVITIATGRNYPKAKSIIDAFGIKDPVIVNGGSQIVSPIDGKPIWESRLDSKTGLVIIKRIKEIISDQDLRIGFGYLEEKMFSDINETDFDTLIYLDVVGIASKEEAEKVIAIVNELPDAHAGSTSSPQFPGRTNINITAKNATKLHAVQELQSILHIPKEHTIAVGDGNNDLPLFESSGLKVAVDNADQALKDASDIVVSSFHEHGILQVIDDYLLAQ